MDAAEIKMHWETWAREFETDLRATTKARSIKKLEVNALCNAIKKMNFSQNEVLDVLEVGCGNGYNLFALSQLFPHFSFTGVDYIPEMIEHAKTIQGEDKDKYAQIDFQVGDILQLDTNEILRESYPIVFTDRCIINLNSTELQLKALKQLSSKVNAGGYLVVLENTKQNFVRQNDCREVLGLAKRVMPEFNHFLDESEFLGADESLELIATDDFGSLHDIVLYVLVPMINQGEIDYDHPLVKVAGDLSSGISEKYETPFGSFGQNRLFLYEKVSR